MPVIFKTWVKLLAELLSAIILLPDQGSLNFTRPTRFDNVRDVTHIIDCFEIFLAALKNLDLQKVTWSEYKHHNTVTFLVRCSPNSSVTFLSIGYPGSISDKKVVLASKLLDTVPNYSYIMADKGFDIEKECIAKNVGLYKPPGKRGTYQMLPAEI